MARPKKYNADYFPHNNDMRNDRRCKALRSKFNLEGYAVFVMLLETLTGANHFQIEDNKMELELIAGDIDIDSKKLNAILEYLVKLGLLVKDGDLISSPMLNDLKNILNDIREKDRGRKINVSEPGYFPSSRGNSLFGFGLHCMILSGKYCRNNLLRIFTYSGPYWDSISILDIFNASSERFTESVRIYVIFPDSYNC